jgi:cell division septal protein FtsQ
VQFLLSFAIEVSVKNMSSSEYASEQVRNKKRAIGAVAIALLLVFTVLAILGYINFIVWVAADLVVAGIANLLLRRIGRTPL